jgi:rhomboid family GlyGly-CTERM serine protease
MQKRTCLPRLLTLLPWASLTLVGVLLGIHSASSSLQDQLVFDRTAVLNGDWWRLISCHFVHRDQTHLILNVLPLLIAGLVYESGRGLQRSFSSLGAIVLGCAAVMAWIWWFSPGTMRYTGLSGPIYALLVVVIFDLYLETGYKWLFLILFFYIGRTLLHWDYPIYTEQTPSVNTLYPAHTVGLVAGFLWVFVQHLFSSVQLAAKPLIIT